MRVVEREVPVVIVDQRRERFIRLSMDEKHQLCVIANYKTAKGVARELNVTIRSAEYIIKKLREKLDCQHKDEVIAFALYAGLINYSQDNNQ